LKSTWKSSRITPMNEVVHANVTALGLARGLQLRCGCRVGADGDPLDGGTDAADFVCLDCGHCDLCCGCVEELTRATYRASAGVTAAEGRPRPPRMDALDPPALIREALSRAL
jgi:hypothetical protein